MYTTPSKVNKCSHVNKNVRFFKNSPKCQMAILQSFRNQPTTTKIKIRMNVCLFSRVLGTFQHWKHPGNEEFSSSRGSRYILKLSRSYSKKTYDLLHLNVNLIIKCKIQHLNVDPIIKCKICQKIPRFVYIHQKKVKLYSFIYF